MCAIDDAPYPEVYHESHPVARRAHACLECGRVVRPGERYRLVRGKWEGVWSTIKECAHCEAIGDVMNVLCGGYPHGELLDELVDHWYEGYRSVAYGRLIALARRRWLDGHAPVPADCAALGRALLVAQHT